MIKDAGFRLLRWSKRGVGAAGSTTVAATAPQSSAAPAPDDPAEPTTYERAQTLLAHRRRRTVVFRERASLFVEVPWGMLLNLFVAHEEQRTMTVAELARAEDVTPSLSARWLNALRKTGLVTANIGSDGERFELASDGLLLTRRFLEEV